MARKQEQQTLIDNTARPIAGGFQIWFVVTADVLPKLERAQAILESAAADILSEEPMDAGHMGWAAKLLERVRTSIEVSVQRPESESEKGTRVSSKGIVVEPKVKHEYGDNGICSVKHDGKHSCGAIRQRRPRSGSAAAAAAAAASKTGDLLATTAGKNGQPELPAVAEVEPCGS